MNVGISFVLLSIVNANEFIWIASDHYTARNTRATELLFRPQVLSHGDPMAPSKAKQPHRRLKSDHSCHLRAGLEHSRHVHTVHEPNMPGRMLAPSGGRLRHQTRSSSALRASSCHLGHQRVAVQRELLSALCRRRALLFGARESSLRSFNGNRAIALSGSRCGRGIAVMKRAASARAFARGLLLFSPEQTG